MKKLLTLLLLAPTLTLAANGFFVGSSIYTNSSESNVSLKSRQLGYNINVGYNFNDKFYMNNTISRHSDGRYGYAIDYGVHDSSGYLRPYADMSYDAYDDSIGYDVGSTINLTKCLVPYIEIDNFLDKYNKSVILGVQVKIYKHMYLKASYEVTKETKSNNYKLGLSYIL